MVTARYLAGGHILHLIPHTTYFSTLWEVMGPKAPDWSYLQSLQGDSLEEEDVDKVYSQCFGKA